MRSPWRRTSTPCDYRRARLVARRSLLLRGRWRACGERATALRRRQLAAQCSRAGTSWRALRACGLRRAIAVSPCARLRAYGCRRVAAARARSGRSSSFAACGAWSFGHWMLGPPTLGRRCHSGSEQGVNASARFWDLPRASTRGALRVPTLPFGCAPRLTALTCAWSLCVRSRRADCYSLITLLRRRAGAALRASCRLIRAGWGSAAPLRRWPKARGGGRLREDACMTRTAARRRAWRSVAGPG